MMDISYWSQATGFLTGPWSVEQKAMALVMGLGLIKACCAMVALFRLGLGFSSWNRACKKVLGVSWASLAFKPASTRGVGAGQPALPSGLGAMLGLCLIAGGYGLAQIFGVQGAEQGARWASAGWPNMLYSGAFDAFQTLFLSLWPVFLLGQALKDESSPVGAAFAEQRRLARGGEPR